MLESGMSTLNWTLPSLSWTGLWSLAAALVYILGLLHAGHAIMRVRLAQSAIAWSIFLMSMPLFAVPLYWIFGRRKFEGYTAQMTKARQRFQKERGDAARRIVPFVSQSDGILGTLNRVAVQLGAVPFTWGNHAALLVDGEATYDALVQSIDHASKYVLFQTYILKDDSTGQRFLKALVAAARRGVRVHLLYDEVGSSGLTRRFLNEARSEGIVTSGFKTTKHGNRFQLNFRNHRKVLVVDGHHGFVGGLNICNDHITRDDVPGWRDTHLQLSGPAVAAVQHSFLSDWYWAMDDVPQVSWVLPETPPLGSPHQGHDVMILSSGPADGIESCSLFIGSLIDLAKERIWIATPYFVPDEPTLSALKIAALRGVDVRLIVPRNPDHVIMRWCTLSYYDDLRHVGIKVFEYVPRFMHQKVLLIDDFMAGVGTVNLDNRSLHLNFEVMAFVSSPAFVANVASMLQDDLHQCEEANLEAFSLASLPTRVAIKVTRLFSAVL
jgi:cardiolipin synthase